MGDKMNICFLLTSDGWGGAENVVYNLAKFVEKKGHNISVILNEEEYPYFKDLKNVDLYNIGPVFDYEKFLKANFGISIPPFFPDFGIISKGLKFFLVPLLRDLNYRKIRGNVLKTINKINPDVIHFHNPIVLDFYSYIYSDLDVPKMYTAQGQDYNIPFRNQPFIKGIKLRKTMESFDYVIAGSNYLKNTITSANYHFSKEVKVIYNGVSIIDFQNIKRKKLPDNFNICFAGGMKGNKGGDIVIKAMKILKYRSLDVHLYITKEVSENHVYRDMVSNLGLDDNITFLGLLPKDDYFPLLNSMDAIVMPTKIEGFSILYLEGMAFGIPIITTPYGGTKELIKHKKSGLYIKRNPEDVAEKITYLYNNPKLRKEISENNMKDVERFDWGNIADQYIEIYETLKR